MESWARVAVLLLAAVSRPAALPGQGEGGAADHMVRLSPHAWAWIAADDRSSNSALIVGDSGALVVDPGLTPGVVREFLAAVRSVTDRPVRYVVLTHWHPDHALGITCLADRFATIVAHPATRRALADHGAQVAAQLAAEAPTADERKSLETCAGRLPDSLVADRTVIDLEGVAVEVWHPGWAHTAGDLVVWLPGERVLVTGDIFMHEASPDMDGAHPVEWAVVLDSLVGLVPSAVVAGHFGPSTPRDLVRFRDYLHAVVDRSRDALDRGVPPDSVPDRVSLQDFGEFVQYPQYHATFRDNVRATVRQLDGGRD